MYRLKCKRWISPFDRAGLWIVKRFPDMLCGKRGKTIEKKLKMLETTRGTCSVEEYYGRKFSKILKLFAAGGLILGILGFSYSGNVSWLKESVLERPDVGKGKLQTELQASIQSGELITVPVVIGERIYSDAEIKEIFAGILKGLEKEILGKNTSLKEVRTDLNLPETFLNGVVKAVWEVTPHGYMDETGHLKKEVPEKGVEGVLRLTLYYQEETLLQEYPLNLLPLVKTKEEQQADALKAMVEQAAEEYPEEREVRLPEMLDGQKVKWGNYRQNPMVPGIFLLLMGMLFLNEREDQRLEEEEKRRRRQLIMDYPAILYRMSMLLEAGMTIRGAFSKIAFFYGERKKEGIRYAYEAMLLSCYELHKGIGEAAVYEKFGQRCQEIQYLKFGSMLSQNLKKGSEDLAQLLEEEARAGMEERKNLAKKLGEEAGMKLLFPMLLMLILVMVLLMVPAMISF